MENGEEEEDSSASRVARRVSGSSSSPARGSLVMAGTGLSGMLWSEVRRVVVVAWSRGGGLGGAGDMLDSLDFFSLPLETEGGDNNVLLD